MSLVSLKLKHVATRKFKITYLVCTIFLLNSTGPAKVKQRAHPGWSALERGPARRACYALLTGLTMKFIWG